MPRANSFSDDGRSLTPDLDDHEEELRRSLDEAHDLPAPLPPPTHFRHTFPTLGPPGALEQLLTQLRARWVPVRQTGGANAAPGNAGQKGQPGLATGAHLTVDGHVYAIGSDWLVRAGNVIISPGGAMKGMLLEVRTYGVVATIACITW